MYQRHPNINFSFEKDDVFSFLDVKVVREEGKFSTTVFRKPTFFPDYYKFGLIFILLYRCFTIVSDYSKFHVEISFLKTVLRKSGYHSNIINRCVKMFLNKIVNVKTAVPNFDVP